MGSIALRSRGVLPARSSNLAVERRASQEVFDKPIGLQRDLLHCLSRPAMPD